MYHLLNTVTSCRLCKHYDPIGRRVGTCQKLDAPVCASWSACRLAMSPFAALEDILLQNAPVLSNNVPALL